MSLTDEEHVKVLLLRVELHQTLARLVPQSDADGQPTGLGAYILAKEILDCFDKSLIGVVEAFHIDHLAFGGIAVSVAAIHFTHGEGGLAAVGLTHKELQTAMNDIDDCAALTLGDALCQLQHISVGSVVRIVVSHNKYLFLPCLTGY